MLSIAGNYPRVFRHPDRLRSPVPPPNILHRPPELAYGNGYGAPHRADRWQSRASPPIVIQRTPNLSYNGYAGGGYSGPGNQRMFLSFVHKPCH